MATFKCTFTNSKTKERVVQDYQINPLYLKEFAEEQLVDNQTNLELGAVVFDTLDIVNQYGDVRFRFRVDEHKFVERVW